MFGGAYRGARVLVTGHTGFKGSWLCHWLIRLGAEVTGIALAPTSTPNLFDTLSLERRLDHQLIDIRDADRVRQAMECARPRFVFHLAAQPLVRQSYAEPKATFDINVGGTVNVLEAVRAVASVRSCVVVTTDKCYENREWDRGYREEDPLGGHDPYSASKAAAEIAVASWRRALFTDGRVRLASVRAGNVIGGGDWSRDRLVPDFVAAIAAGRTLDLRNPRATRPWQHVLEPISAYLHLGALLAQDDGERFAEAWNIGPHDDSVITVERLARLLSAAWGHGEVVERTRHDQPHEAGSLKLDITKTIARLGWQPVWTVEKAVAHSIAWYRTHRDGGDCSLLSGRQIDEYCADAQVQTWTGAQRRDG